MLACLFSYIGWFLWLIKMDGFVRGAGGATGLGVGWAISRNTFVGKEILYMCVLREQWMDACVRCWDWDCNCVVLMDWMFGLDFTREI